MNQATAKTKILIIAPALPLVGGQAVQSQRLLENFRREALLSVDLQPINPQVAPRLQKIPYLRTVVTTLKYLFDITRKIPRADIVHVFSASYYGVVLSVVPAVLLARVFGKKAIINYRSGEAENFFRGWGRHFLWALRMADAVVSPSGYLVDVFAKFGIEGRSIFNIIDTDKFTFRERRTLRPIFLSNRILESLYNIECIFRAFEIIGKKFPDAELIVANDGIERKNLERAAREMNLKNVRFIGLVPHDKIAALYDSVDVYLNSPNFDCMPGSLIECFASGLPVVSTDAGGIPYIVADGETGLLVETNDHEALAAKAIYLLENPEIARTITGNARRECAKYSWEAIRPQWLALYEKLAAELKGKPIEPQKLLEIEISEK
ncbi:MAG TPA: glycosyltransferase family 4 protein [Pyrinomonadaceae bacterium]|nr:glycosyltransferase family 4 protein [Pyrinomonadaceae bacterium]